MAKGYSDGIKRIAWEIGHEAARQLRGFDREAKRQLTGFGGEAARQLGGFGQELAKQVFGSAGRRRGKRE